MNRFAFLVAVLLLTASGSIFGFGSRVLKPSRFSEHAFLAECGNVRRCKVTYADQVHVDDSGDREPRPLRGDLLTRTRPGLIGIENFPGPAVVTWQSMDGESHEEKVDISSIFKDRVVLHAEPVEDIEDNHAYGQPVIFLVVDDRTIRVYMRSMVFVKGGSREMPTTRHDSVLAYSRTY
jgi:hypothetical protein